MMKGRAQAGGGELTIAVVSDSPEFVRLLESRWKDERVLPTFAVFAADPPPAALPACELVVVGGVAAERLRPLLRTLAPASRPLICVVEVEDYSGLRGSVPQMLLLRREGAWLDTVVVLAGECLRRSQAVLRAQRAEQLLVAGERHAVLGKYLVEMRHNINNALTSVLGNSELMLMNVEDFSSEARGQLETIRDTALRLHEIMRRFWSLESEMRVVERESSEERQLPQDIASGSLP
jgi:signal transduction histidine kinase